MKAPVGSRPGDRTLFCFITALALLAGSCVFSAGCDSAANPVAPTQYPTSTPPEPQKTSRVTTWPDGLWLEHNPAAPGVHVCRTQPRMYSDAAGQIVWTVEYYTVVAPDTCPAQPIE
jgi:phage baseplate assembly protein gpV